MRVALGIPPADTFSEINKLLTYWSLLSHSVVKVG
jgi:hypothetical protein